MRERSFAGLALMAMLTLVAAVSGGHAATAHTASGRSSGELTFKKNKVKVGDKKVAFDKLHSLVAEPNASAAPAKSEPPEGKPTPHTVWLKGGQRWRGEIVSYNAESLTFKGPRLGKKTLPAKRLRAIDFTAGLYTPPRDAASKLMRQEGEPVPAELMWVREKKLAVDSVLGVLTLKRDAVTRFVFSGAGGSGDAGDGAAAQTTLTRANGTRLSGKDAKLTKKGIKLTHPALGELTIPGEAIGAIHRRPKGVTYLTELDRQVEATPLLAPSAEGLELVRALGPEAARAHGGVTALRLEPVSTTRLTLPEDVGGGKLHATLHGLPNAAGQVKLRMSADGDTLKKKTVKPAGDAESLKVELPDADTLTIEVDFAETVGLPAGAILVEPRIVHGGDA